MTKRIGRWPTLLFLTLFTLLVSCNSREEIPTLAATAPPPPTPRSTNTPVPTSTVTPTPTPTPTPTLTPTPTVTPVIARIEETPFAQSGVNITSPREGGESIQGEEIPIGGLIQLGAAETLSVTLVSANNQILAIADVDVHQFSNWDGTVTIPLTYSGSAWLVAKILDEGNIVIGADMQELKVELNLEASEQYLDLYRPEGGDKVVAGYNIFFDGWVQLPANNLVSISIWTDECQIQIARQSFRLRGSGYWQGFLVVPSNASGPACALAHFGEVGDDNRREAQIGVNILPINSDESYGVLVGNPPPESFVAPGRTLLLYGTAYNAPDGEVRLTIQTEDGRLITEGITSADVFGYWELSLFIPDGDVGLAEISAAIGDKDDDSYADHRIIVQIVGSD
jgi:hypothetical protein